MAPATGRRWNVFHMLLAVAMLGLAVANVLLYAEYRQFHSGDDSLEAQAKQLLTVTGAPTSAPAKPASKPAAKPPVRPEAKPASAPKAAPAAKPEPAKTPAPAAPAPKK